MPGKYDILSLIIVMVYKKMTQAQTGLIQALKSGAKLSLAHVFF